MVDGTYIHPVTVTFLLISNAMIAANVNLNKKTAEKLISAVLVLKLNLVS